jgi:hypothetical protein
MTEGEDATFLQFDRFAAPLAEIQLSAGYRLARI